jgi:hypothetical protein
MRIDVHIERLVLDGLPVTSADGPRVRAAVEAELARLLAAGGLGRELVAGAAMARAPAPQISIGQGERPDAIGRAVARSVHAGIEGRQ